jgi:hypothetical protein
VEAVDFTSDARWLVWIGDQIGGGVPTSCVARAFFPPDALGEAMVGFDHVPIVNCCSFFEFVLTIKGPVQGEFAVVHQHILYGGQVLHCCS